MSQFLLQIGLKLKELSSFIIKLANKKEICENEKKLKLEIKRYTSDVKEFFEKPENNIKKIKEKDLRHLSFLYHCLKQTIALYDTETEALPIQIFNEIRNGFDHFQRSLLFDQRKLKKSHLTKSEGHIQRALLDVCKLICLFYDAKINKIHKRYPHKSLSLVNDGEYIKEFSQKELICKKSLHDAKLNDYLLGDNQTENKKVLYKYVVAFIRYKKLFEFQQSHIGNLRLARCRYYSIKGISFIIIFLLSIISTLIANYLSGGKLQEVIINLFK